MYVEQVWDKGIGQRLKYLIDIFYGGIPQFVQQFGFNESQIYRICKGASNPSSEYLAKLGAIGFNVHWLVCGDGPWWAPNPAGETLKKMDDGWRAAEKKPKRTVQKGFQ
jgi:hypothetical protein